MSTAPTDGQRLAVYGTLRPGRSNHHEVAAIPGSWTQGVVHGHLLPEGWGAALGYPAIELDEDAPAVPVHLLTSDALPRHWARLDEFEGPGYRRVACTVRTEAGPVQAQIYELDR
ncbi:gamma-glutamylcyclotransferase family protein [Arsenicicoccus dermatophilus]|uniref:gamma-glutamylcyclotransferase family protein n=1 Tax=Arsenicicoccus dermatophilus TaxID=1076331 RepID=UPI001F4C6A67|nr:gamma-glutamylcyclotransferase [Arsenicicoccus dermatophilus]